MEKFSGNPSSWVVCQLGAREHYAVASSLNQYGALTGMFTDVWSKPGFLTGRFSKRVSDRFCSGLNGVFIGSCNLSAFLFETKLLNRRQRDWHAVMKRNVWFQSKAVKWLSKNEATLKRDGLNVLFAYSYAALEIIKWGRDRGWKTVLGQIDGGIEEEILVNSIPGTEGLVRAPDRYWQDWIVECSLADYIVVNSRWSANLIGRAVSIQKAKVIPLAFGNSHNAEIMTKCYPQEFTRERPLRILFLGQVAVRKGVLEMLIAAEMIRHLPVEFFVVGPIVSFVPDRLRRLENVKFIGPVARSEAGTWYRMADVFLFPTHSDGYGLTQLEAQSWGLPLVASRNCGEVVVENVNGITIPEVTPEEIAKAIVYLCKNPMQLEQLSMNRRDLSEFSFRGIGKQFLKLFDMQQ